MVTKKVLRYYADCGRAFWKKYLCLNHEKNCKCWTNEKFKTCLTCKFKNIVNDSNGMEDHNRETWQWNDCKNPEMNMETMFNEAHKNAPNICLNCQKWVSKKEREV